MALAITLLIIAVFWAGIVIGIITIIITGIRLEDRAKTLTGIPRTPAEAAVRWMLGVGVRNGKADSDERGDEWTNGQH
jgi:hypothetical protein